MQKHRRFGIESGVFSREVYPEFGYSVVPVGRPFR